LVVALPEEAFFRGYLQTSLDDRWGTPWKILGARLGLSLVVTSATFALGHLAALPYLARLAVFFPSLLFGYLRTRSGGVGAPLLFHAVCNVFAAWLAAAYGFETSH
jgi:membrane protease YdiL (CAAX protease family)